MRVGVKDAPRLQFAPPPQPSAKKLPLMHDGDSPIIAGCLVTSRGDYCGAGKRHNQSWGRKRVTPRASSACCRLKVVKQALSGELTTRVGVAVRNQLHRKPAGGS